MKYATKEEAMQHISTNPKISAKQITMIDCMYAIGGCVSQNDLDNIELDNHKDNMRKAMSY